MYENVTKNMGEVLTLKAKYFFLYTYTLNVPTYERKKIKIELNVKEAKKKEMMKNINCTLFIFFLMYVFINFFMSFNIQFN